MKKSLIVLVAALIAGGGFIAFRRGVHEGELPREGVSVEQAGRKEEARRESEDAAEEVRPEPTPVIEVVAENLTIPWDVAFLPDGDMLVTERDGTLLRLGRDGARQEIAIGGVRHRGEGGLLGLALHPEFARTSWLYLYSTTEERGGTVNRVARYRLFGGTLTDETTIVADIPGARFHNGGRIDFGPDGKLYITTGDASDADLAQNLDSLAGKILRVNDDGSIPPNNPFGTAVYSYGHRNPQGLAWDSAGRLWSTEHGRSGVTSGLDELNLIEAGVNYGWPVIEGDETREDMRGPVMHSGPDHTWAPASATYVGESVFFGGLRGVALYEAKLSGTAATLIRHFTDEYGRVRAARVGPDGFLYITTSNRDGRGSVREGDDKIIRIDPRVFE